VIQPRTEGAGHTDVAEARRVLDRVEQTSLAAALERHQQLIAFRLRRPAVDDDVDDAAGLRADGRVEVDGERPEVSRFVGSPRAQAAADHHRRRHRGAGQPS